MTDYCRMFEDAVRDNDDLKASILITKLIELDMLNPACNQGSNPPLLAAAIYNKLHLINVIIKGNGDVNLQDLSNGFTALMLASRNGHKDSVRLLLEAGAAPDMQNADGYTALMLAGRNGYTECVKLLLKRGANVDVQNEDGYTALMQSSMRGHKNCVKLLLRARANKNMRDASGFTALELAECFGYKECVELLQL